ncbi:MAG TPA: peroxiredoxin-like family protein [Xanthomonadales bacterium]|nr:peroxiredoxin-like family protein [Xanthomonadales bacterium]
MPFYKNLLVLFVLVCVSTGLWAEANEAPDRSVIHKDALQVQPLLPGMAAPVFDLRDATGAKVSFDPKSLQKPVILTFFRGGWCPYCNLHLAEMRKAEAELKDLGFDLWFISPDRPELLYESLEQPDIGYTVYSDARLQAMRAFGIAFRVDDETNSKYIEYGVNLDEISGEGDHVLPVPSTYLIGTDGLIHFQYTNPDYVVRLHPSVLLAAARAYKNDEDARLTRELQARRAKEEN